MTFNTTEMCGVSMLADNIESEPLDSTEFNIVRPAIMVI